MGPRLLLSARDGPPHPLRRSAERGARSVRYGASPFLCPLGAGRGGGATHQKPPQGDAGAIRGLGAAANNRQTQVHTISSLPASPSCPPFEPCIYLAGGRFGGP